MPDHALPADLQQALRSTDSIEGVGRIVKSHARRLLDAHGATFILADGDQCFYADEDAIAPLWRGQRFPMSHCISGWVMMHHEAAAIPDIRVDPRIPQEAYAPTFVRSLLMTPVGTPAVAAIGAYWGARHIATSTEIRWASLLAEETERAMDRLGLDDAPWAPTFASRGALEAPS